MSATCRRCRRLPLKKPSEFKLIGKPLPRLDIPAKVLGVATFGIDVRRPNLLYAAVLNAPTFGGSATGFKVKGSLPKGVETVIIVPGGIAAIGTSWWRANKLLQEGVEVQWQPGPEPNLDSATLWRRYEGLMQDGKPALTRTLGEEKKPATVRPIEATYRAPYLAHTTMEPMNCTAQVTRQGDKNGVEVWMPNQSPTLMRLIAGKTADVPQAQVTVRTTFLGGGFGRRAEVDLVRQAVTCAMAMPERPVQVLWSREQDIRHDYYRPMALARWRAELDTSGGAPKLVSVAKRQVAQSPADQFPARVIGLPSQGKPEGNAVENPPYAFPFYKLEAVVPDGSVPVGFWRSVGHSHTAFFDESFVDELASALKKDPFEFRRELLAGKPRHLKVLETAAKEAGWGQPLPAGSGRGIALRASFGSIVAQVAEVVVADGNDPAGQARHLRHRLRSGGQSRHRARADGERHHLRPLGRALRRDHAGQRRRRAVELPRLRRRAPGRCAGDDGASGRHRLVFHRRRRRTRHPADRAGRRQCGLRRHGQAPAQLAAVEPRLQSGCVGR